jgi:hypothetical protein
LDTCTARRTHNSKFSGVRIPVSLCVAALVLASCAPAPASSVSASSAPVAVSPSGTPAVTSSNAPTPAASNASPSPMAVALGVEGDAPQFLTSRRTGVFALGVKHAWVSDDGLAWDLSEASLPDGVVVRLIERGDATLLAFGYASGPSGEFRTWTSADGGNWQAADVGLPSAFIFLDIGRGERGYVLVGRAILDGASPEQLWFSPDAINWEPMYSTSDDESLAAIGAGPEGFVAVGQQGFRTGPPRAFALASADGREWFRAAEGSALATAGSLWSVVPLEGDWVTSPATVGTDLPILWSPNGLDWEDRTSLPIERVDTGVIASLMSNGSRLYAAVADGGGQPVSSVLLTSLDGITWSETEIPHTDRWNFAAADGVDVFLVGDTMHTHRE